MSNLEFEVPNYLQSLNSQGIAIPDAMRLAQEKYSSIAAVDILKFARGIYQDRAVMRIHSFPEYDMIVTEQGIEAVQKIIVASISEDTLVAYAVLLANSGYDALEVGYALKHEFQETTPLQLQKALEAANYGQPSVLASIACVFQQKITPFEVQAKPKWQETGFQIQANPRMYGQVEIARLSGEWTPNPATGMVDADGNSSYTAKSGYTLPGEKEGALIGRMDQSLFLVGNHGTSLSGQQGRLALIINDDLDQTYGEGFSDNQGSLMLELSFSIVLIS